jgi:hypothetical protein
MPFLVATWVSCGNYPETGSAHAYESPKPLRYLKSVGRRPHRSSMFVRHSRRRKSLASYYPRSRRSAIPVVIAVMVALAVCYVAKLVMSALAAALLAFVLEPIVRENKVRMHGIGR